VWWETVSRIEPEQLVFLDESGATTEMTRRYGRALRGERVREAAPAGHWSTLTLLGRHARVEFARERAPLLLIGGEEDHIIPASLNRTNFRRYRKTPSTTEFKEFAGRSHYSVIAGPGWEQVADYALDWALRKAERAPSAGAVGTAAADPVPWDGAVEPTATAAPRTAPDALA
jgi:pimeloyl-ACP methyl ester carboxylesterase